MKKILVLIALLVIVVPISVGASSETKKVKIEFVSNNNPIEYIIKFRLKTNNQYIDDRIYETDNNGVFNGELELEDGIYELEVIEIPSNILVHTVTFNVDSEDIFLVNDFEEKKGSINITRNGSIIVNDDEISLGIVNDVLYEIYAMEDINSFTGTKYYKDQLVKTMTTINGVATTELPLGKYYVNEIQIKDFYKLGISIEASLNLENPDYYSIISTIHRPLIIRTNVDYKLYSDEDIDVKDASSKTLLTIYKETVFDNKDFYNLPYGKYRFESEKFSTTIDFNEENEYFEYYVNNDSFGNDSNFDDKKDDEIDEVPGNDENNNPSDDLDEKEDSNDDEVDKVPESDQNNNQSNNYSNKNEDSEDSKDDDEIDKESDSNQNNDSKDDNLKDNSSSLGSTSSKMPITSTRSNKYSLLLSGIVLIILSIIKK